MTGRDRLRYTLMLVVVVICAALVVLILFYNRATLPLETMTKVAMHADITLGDLNYTESENGVAKWNLIAESAAHNVDSTITDLKHVKLTLFTKEKIGTVVLTAKSGTLSMQDRNVAVAGDVVITTQNGYRFTSQAATFKGQSVHDGIISSDDWVKIVTEQLVITGSGLRIDLAEGKFSLLRHVKVIYSSKSSTLNGGK